MGTTETSSLSRARVLVLLLAVLLVAAACGDDDDVAVGDDTTTSTPTTEAPDETTTTTRPDTGPPDRAVALTTAGDLVVLEIDGGGATTVARGIDVSDPAKNGVAVTPDRTAAFVAAPSSETGDTVIRRFALDDGMQAGEQVATGLAPAVSPDGSTLAYVHFTGGGPQPADQPEPTIVLRDLDTGEETVLASGDQQPFVFISDLAFTDDGSRVAFVAGEVQTGVWIVDRDADDLDEAARLGPVAREEGSRWTRVTNFGDGKLVVAEDCCDLPPQREVVLLLNLDPLTVEGGLLPTETGASYLDISREGQHLLYVSDRTLFRWSDGDAQVTELRDGVVAGAW